MSEREGDRQIDRQRKAERKIDRERERESARERERERERVRESESESERARERARVAPCWGEARVIKLIIETASMEPSGERGCGVCVLTLSGWCKAACNRELKLPWREACPPNHHENKVNSDH